MSDPPVLDLDADDLHQQRLGLRNDIHRRWRGDNDRGHRHCDQCVDTGVGDNHPDEPAPRRPPVRERNVVASGVTAVYDPGTGVMTLTGTAPAAAYQGRVGPDRLLQQQRRSVDRRPASITVAGNDGINDSAHRGRHRQRRGGERPGCVDLTPVSRLTVFDILPSSLQLPAPTCRSLTRMAIAISAIA